MVSRAPPGGWVLSLAVLLFLSGGIASGQGQGTGILTGTVTDNAGVIPGAAVTITDITTGLVRPVASNDQGVFRVPSLPPGRYAVRVEVDGFKQITISDVALLGGETRDLGKLALQVGIRSETVTVTAESTPVQTADSTLQRNLTGDQLTMIQVKGRDIFPW